jgi:choline dehydrogenase-like flavoprotein
MEEADVVVVGGRLAGCAIAAPLARAGRRVLGDLRAELRIRGERRADRVRSTRTITGSEHPGAAWPAPPTSSRPAEAPAPEPAKAGA